MHSILELLSDPEPLNKKFETPLDLALQAGHYQRIREVYENLEIYHAPTMHLPGTNLQMQSFENSMEWME